MPLRADLRHVTRAAFGFRKRDLDLRRMEHALERIVEPVGAETSAAVGVIDEDAFHALYHGTAAPLRAYAARVLGNVTQADDIVQEAYLRILRAPLRTDDPQHIRAYLFRIASNLMSDHFRRQKWETTVKDMPELATVDSDTSTRLDMARMFRRLRPRDRQLLWLAHVEGADHREVAKALGLGERSVRVLLFRARQKLAKLIRESQR
jgi:RNA polymerase sigma-70 factor (ECF subfamily)